MTSCLVRLVRVEGGERGLQDVFERAGWTEGSAYLENNENWVTLDMAMGLLQAGVDVLGDPTLPRRVGAESVRQHAGSPVATLLRGARLPGGAARRDDDRRGQVQHGHRDGGDRGAPRLRRRDGAREARLRAPPAALRLGARPGVAGDRPVRPSARARRGDRSARRSGDDACVYTVSWDAELAAAAKDPEKRATALEAQLVALSQRLQSVYATAGDLVSANDLDTLLTRIVERTASEVRATGYALAVRPEPGRRATDLQPRHVGGGRARPGRAARRRRGAARLRARRRRRDEPSRVRPPAGASPRTVSTSSPRSATCSRCTRSTPPPCSTWRRRCATPLAGTTRSRALLQLAHALARAGTSGEVAARLAEAVPAVVDCDAAAVWLWDSGEECMRLTARQGSEREHGDPGRHHDPRGRHAAARERHRVRPNRLSTTVPSRIRGSRG